jgi:tetratricopeptide (TPR) repeat protein
MNTDNGELIWSARVDGDLGRNYRVVLDRLSDTVRNYMEIKALEAKVESDYSNAFPNSAEAYRHYIDGLNAIVASNYESAIESLLKAYEIDTTFTFAAFYLAFAHNFSLQSDLNEGTILWTKRAHELKNNLPPAYHPWIEMWYACDREDVNDIRKYCDLMYEAALHNRFLILDLGVTYSDMLGDYEKSIKAYEKVEELNIKWDDDWKYERYYENYCWTLLEVGRPGDAIRIAEKGLLINPDNGWLKLYRGSGYIMLGDTVAIKKSFEELRKAFEKYNATESDKERFIGLMYLMANDSVSAEEHYRKAYKLDPENLNRIVILARVLIESGSHIEEGLALTEKGLKLYPDNLNLLTWKGAALHKLGKHSEALAVLNKVDENFTGYHRLLKGYIHEAEQALAKQNH